jgi:two-component system, response regulator PdtaR
MLSFMESVEGQWMPREFARRIPKLLGAFARLLCMSEAEQPLVLVVEDEELLRLHAANLLEDHGYRVIEAANAAAALKVLETRNDVRLLFTDIQMPGRIDGMDLARQVHARWPNVLLLITSGQILPTRAEIPDDGRFVAKPYRSYELLAHVDDLAGRT